MRISDWSSDVCSSDLIAVQARVEERYRQAVISLRTPILGTDTFSAEVHAELDFSEQQATRESFPSDESRIKSEQGSWTAAKENASAYGMPGALSDQAPPPAVPGSQPANAAPGAAQTAVAAGKTDDNYVRDCTLGTDVTVTRTALCSVN